MMLTEIPPFLATTLTGELESAFERMPFVPGKLAVCFLVLLSTLSWSIILCKALIFSRIRGADRKFKKKLRHSKSCLEIYESGENHAPSLLFDVYEEGARIAAVEMVGASAPQFIREKKFATYGGMTRNQLDVVESGLIYRARAAIDRLRGGLKFLRMVATVAPMIGITGACWVLVTALSPEGVSFRLLLNYALIIIMASLFVSAPAGIARVYFLNKARRKGRKVRLFVTRILQVFSDSFEKPEFLRKDDDRGAVSPTPARQEPLASEPHHMEPSGMEMTPQRASNPASDEPGTVPHLVAPPEKECPAAVSFESPFTLDDDMAEYDSPPLEVSENDYRKPRATDDKDNRPPKAPNPDHPYVSANYY